MLIVSNLMFSYNNKRPIFSNVSFTLEAGQMMRIKGSNGKGKSTLLKVLLGLLASDDGTITLDATDDLDYFRSNCEYLSAENNALFEDMTAHENLTNWINLRSRNISSESIEITLEKWGFKDKYLTQQLPVGKFSTGMKRRLAMARVELSAAKLWFLDEPLYGLDTSGAALFKGMLNQHSANGGLSIIVNHEEGFFKEGFSGEFSTLELGL